MLIATGGFQSGARQSPLQKPLIPQRNIPETRAPAPPPTAFRPRRHEPVIAVTWRGDATLRPVANATAPGLLGDGTLRIAATLIDSVASSSTIVDERPADSRGTVPIVAHAAPSPAVPSHDREQVASLTPPERPAPPPPVAAWRVYAQHFDATDARPRIALIVAGVDDEMESAIASLPAPVTLALDPYARRLPEWIDLARSRGHEVVLTLSTPPIAHDRRNAGPMAILSSLNPTENLERLDWALGRAAGFVGVVDIVGNRPAAETDPILEKLGEQGLMLVSGTALPGATPVVPVETGDVVISPNLSRRDIDRRLAALQDKARSDGHAVGIVVADAALFRHLQAWLASLGRQQITLAPATAMIAAPDSGIAKE